MSKFHRHLSFQSLESRRLLAGVDIPDNLTGNAGGQIVAPVNVDNAAGIRGAEIRLKYDTSVLDLTSASVTAGSVWSNASDTQVTANVDDATGTVIVFLSASTPLSSGSGSLVQFAFTVAASASAGTTTALDLTQVVLNETGVPVSPAPISGTDPTDGLITITANSGGGAATISGFAYADGNRNNTPDSGEGIPGVIITLVNTVSGQQMQTTTDRGGRYQFSNVAEGTYAIRERQPVAYLEGGSNELIVTMTSNQALSDQNFREAGLLPMYIYNRLHTTIVQPVGSSAWTAAIVQVNLDAESGTIASPSADVVNSSDSTQATGELMTSLVLSNQSSAIASNTTADSFENSDDTQAAGEPDVDTLYGLLWYESLNSQGSRNELTSDSVDAVYDRALESLFLGSADS